MLSAPLRFHATLLTAFHSPSPFSSFCPSIARFLTEASYSLPALSLQPLFVVLLSPSLLTVFLPIFHVASLVPLKLLLLLDASAWVPDPVQPLELFSDAAGGRLGAAPDEQGIRAQNAWRLRLALRWFSIALLATVLVDAPWQ